MKKIFVILIVLSIGLIAQSGSKDPNIELPDFVITGVQSVSLPILNKNKSEFVSVVGDNFLIPKFDSAVLELMSSTAPVKKTMEFYSSKESYNGLLKLGAGKHTVPIGQVDFNFNKNNFLFNSNIFGSDIREYVPYAGYNTSGAKVNLSYFVNHRASFLPGLIVKAEGSFVRNKYNFYGGSIPALQRENEGYSGSIDFINRLDKDFLYGASLSNIFFNMKTDGVKENLNRVNGFLEYSLGPLSVGTEGFYQIQQINDIKLKYTKYNYFGGNAYLNFKNSDIFNLKIGAHYSQQDTNYIFSPMAVLSVFVEQGATLFLSYEGKSELFTTNNFLFENRFFESIQHNIFRKNLSKLMASIKYDYSDIFEINAGFYSSKFDNYHYYESVSNQNGFSIFTADGVKETGLFFNALITTKNYGNLFVDFNFNDVQNNTGNKIPYKPFINGSLSYGYHLKFGLYSNIRVNYLSSVYTDLLNSNKLNDYINISLLLKYNLFESLAITCDFQNILNRKNFLLMGYQEKPLDIIVGIEYSW